MKPGRAAFCRPDGLPIQFIQGGKTMEYTANEVICKCKHVTLADIDRALHQHTSFTDVEKEFDEVQKLTSCSTGCGGCHDKIMRIISDIISG